ncbi:hypothetical protein BH20CHL1_BH20CHL1_06740 [soil metagenome]|jgi:hypothetical protein|nr:hypothetical protein [Chloroflexia bacterium]
MTPEEYVAQVEQFAKKGEANRLLEFANEHGPDLRDSLTGEQRHKLSYLAEWAIMLVDLQEAARQKV